MASLPFTLRQLRYFVFAAEAGTVIGAASKLGVSSSALSDAITELQRVLDTTLCVRTKSQGLTLTPAGTRFLADARRLLHQAADLASALATDAREPSGPLVVSCYPTLAPAILPVFLENFQKQHPLVRLAVTEGTQDKLKDQLESGEVDIAIAYDGPIRGELRGARLFELHAYVLVAASDPLAGRKTIRLEEMVDGDLIFFEAAPSGDHTLSLFAEHGLYPKILHRTESFEVVRTLVARGLGYGILVQRPVNTASYEGLPLAMIEIDPPVRPVGVNILWSNRPDVPRRVTALIDFACSYQWAASG